MNKTNSLWQDATQLSNIWSSSNKRVWYKPWRPPRLGPPSARFDRIQASPAHPTVDLLLHSRWGPWCSEIRQYLSLSLRKWTSGPAGFLKCLKLGKAPPNIVKDNSQARKINCWGVGGQAGASVSQVGKDRGETEDQICPWSCSRLETETWSSICCPGSDHQTWTLLHS